MLRKGCIQGIFWLLPSVAPSYPIPFLLKFYLITIQVGTHRFVGGRHLPSSLAEIYFFPILHIYQARERRMRVYLYTPRPYITGGRVGRARLNRAAAVRNKYSRSVLICLHIQSACWVSTISTFYI